MDNILCTDTYILNNEYTLRSVEDYNMSCYGWHSQEWTDGSNTYATGSTQKFTVPNVYLSAVWKKNTYYATFYTQDAVGNYSVLSVLSGEYESSTGKPSPDPTRTGFRFSNWKTQDWNSISSNLDVYPDFIRILNVYFRYKYNNTEENLCSYVCDYGTELAYPSKDDFSKAKYTITGFEPSALLSVTESTTVEVVDISNHFDITLIGSGAVKWDGESHAISAQVSEVPDTKVPYVVTYCEDGLQQSSPIFHEDLGIYPLTVTVSADNYFSNVAYGSFVIENGNTLTVTFNYYTENDDSVSSQNTVFENRDTVSADIPLKTHTRVFSGWDHPEYMQKVTENRTLNAQYGTRYYTTNYFWDEVGDCAPISATTVEYCGNSYALVKEPSKDGYVFNSWCKKWQSSLKTRDERVMYGVNELSSIKEDNLSAYAFMQKIHNVGLYNVVDGCASLSNTVTVLDYEYQTSSDIGLSTVQYHEFEKWMPEPNSEGKWLISSDCGLSAIYKSLSGVLTYHSNYPKA